METQTQTWYFAKEGERKGPLSQEEVEMLIEQGKITLDTLVSTGADWKPAGNTDLVSFFKTTPGTPPPLPGSAVNNLYVWLVVAVPIIGTIIELLAGEEILWIYWAANIGLCVHDEKKLKAAGHSAPNSWWAILVPVYLWKRANLLQQKKSYFWAWIAACVIGGVMATSGEESALEESAIPLVTQILSENMADSAQCMAVDIQEEVTDNFWKAKATLDNGNDIQITIKRDDDGIEVNVPLNQ